MSREAATPLTTRGRHQAACPAKLHFMTSLSKVRHYKYRNKSPTLLVGEGATWPIRGWREVI